MPAVVLSFPRIFVPSIGSTFGSSPCYPDLASSGRFVTYFGAIVRANMANQEDPNRDLGFGSVVARESRQRLLNKDGSFNVVREGLGPLASHSFYHDLLTISWPRF